MKTTVILVLVMLCFVPTYSQQNDSSAKENNNELSVNMLMSVGLMPEVIYERVLTKKSSVGISAAYCFKDESWPLDYISSAFYRCYFGKKRAAGFFVEGSFSVFQHDESYYLKDLLTDIFGSENTKEDPQFGYGIGGALGSKFIFKNNWTLNVYWGLGKNFIDEHNFDIYPRSGISIGKRF